MKHIQSITNIIIALCVMQLIISCGDKIEGTYYISDSAKKYQIDTTITSFEMIDNFGITEGFYMNQYIWDQTHHYFNEWGTDGDTWGEVYRVAYNSSINAFSFVFVLRAEEDYTEMEVEWNQIDRLNYNLKANLVESGVSANVGFSDSMTVRGVTYYDIIEIDYSERADEIDNETPVKTYISGNKGLIKLVRKDNVVLERKGKNKA